MEIFALSSCWRRFIGVFNVVSEKAQLRISNRASCLQQSLRSRPFSSRSFVLAVKNGCGLGWDGGPDSTGPHAIAIWCGGLEYRSRHLQPLYARFQRSLPRRYVTVRTR